MTLPKHPGTSIVDKAAISQTDESVAGEEDPGAALDMSSSPAAAATGLQPSTPATKVLNPGDEAPPGTPGTGENICRVCGGSGRIIGAFCDSCGGSGKVIVGMGGG